MVLAVSPAARRVSWSALLAHPDVLEGTVLRSVAGVMAFHGGVEAGTAEVAELAADHAGASFYYLIQPPDLRWHVPSHAVDPAASPLLRSWLDHVGVAVSLHGYGRVAQPCRILLGGRNRALAGVIARHLRGALPRFETVTDLPAIPPELRGQHPLNPVNRPTGAGVQVELPLSLRRDPALRALVAEAIAGALGRGPSAF